MSDRHVSQALELVRRSDSDVRRTVALRKHYIGLALQYGVSTLEVARALAMSEDVVFALVAEVRSDAS